jgi:hypothetical protein
LVSRSNIYFRQETNTRYLYLEGELQGCAQGKFSVNIRDCPPAPL